MALKDKILSIARTELNADVRETSRNRGPRIKDYWTATSYPDGETDRQPWCAAFMCFIVREAMKGGKWTFHRPTSASCFEWISWSHRQDDSTKTILEPDRVLKGDVVIYSFSHIGIASCDSKGGLFDAIEGNTDDAGGREGIEVGHKQNRKVAQVKAVIRFTV